MIPPHFRRIRRRGEPWRHGAALAVALAAVAGPALAGSFEQILVARSQANEAEASSQKTIDSLSDQADQLAREYRSVLDNLDGLESYNAQIGKLVESQADDLASLDEQIESISVVARQLTPMMLEMIEALARFVELDLPFLPDERSERIANLEELMDRADVTDAEKYRRVLEAYQIENEYGRTIEAYSGPLAGSDPERMVQYLRIGRLALLYQSLDGSESGVWDRSAGKWVVLGSEYRVPVRNGLRIARKQMAPDLIRIPLPPPEDAR